MIRRLVYRTFASVGLRVERYRDPLADLAAMFPQAKTIIDGGAFDGGLSEEMHRRWPSAEVHAFEPQPDLAAKCRERSAGRWQVHELALSDQPGEATFHIPEAGYEASLLSRDDVPTRDVQVTLTTLDAWADGKPVDILKLDLQGNELAALRGASGMLGNVRAVLCEVNFVPRYDGCTLFHEVVSLLGGRGFRLWRLYEVHSAKSGQWQFADALLVHPAK